MMLMLGPGSISVRSHKSLTSDKAVTSWSCDIPVIQAGVKVNDFLALLIQHEHHHYMYGGNGSVHNNQSAGYCIPNDKGIFT